MPSLLAVVLSERVVHIPLMKRLWIGPIKQQEIDLMAHQNQSFLRHAYAFFLVMDNTASASLISRGVGGQDALKGDSSSLGEGGCGTVVEHGMYIAVKRAKIFDDEASNEQVSIAALTFHSTQMEQHDQG